MWQICYNPLMKVSVLIPYYNDKEFLPKSIESVLNQNYKDFELVLVNHATTDECRDIAHSYTDPRVIHIDMEKNYGAGTGLIMKKFLEKATGEYIKPFCADDIMYPNCLEDLVSYAKTHPDIDMIFGDVEHIDKDEKSLNNSWFKSRYGFKLSNNEADCLRNYFKGHSILPYIGSFVKIGKMREIDIDVSCIMAFDMQLWTSLLLHGCKIGYFDKYVAGYRVHENQMCTSKNVRLIYSRGLYEITGLAKKYMYIEDVDLIKSIFKNNPFKNMDKSDIKFVIAYEMLLSSIPSLSYQGYTIIHSMLQDENTRNYLEKKFKFGIVEFRKVYSSFVVPVDSTEKYLYLLFKRFLQHIGALIHKQTSDRKII